MPAITFDPQDLLRSVVLPVDWYRVRIEQVNVKPASGTNPDTTELYPVRATVICNATNGKTKEDDGTAIAGVPTPPSWQFNNNPNAKGFMVGYFKAFGVKVEPGQALELKATEGRELEVFIEQDTYNGQVVNRINNKYRQVRS